MPRFARSAGGFVWLACILGCGGRSAPPTESSARAAVHDFFEAVIGKDWQKAFAALHPEKRMSFDSFVGLAKNYRGKLGFEPHMVGVRGCEEKGEEAIAHVVIRGGDVFVNPRAELRIPVDSSVETALFVDAGNLWTDPAHVQPLDLRYAVGTGLRIATPIGPLVFDYGFNVDRVLDDFFPKRENQRFWEDIGAFHFSIGLY